MKKALIIISLALTLIITGSLITASELSKWNSSEKTFEEIGYKTKTISETIDISNYEKNSIVYHDDLYSMFVSEKAFDVIVSDKQEPNSLTYEIEYYPDFGECFIDFNDDFDNGYYNQYYRQHSNRNFRHNMHRRFDQSNAENVLGLSSRCYTNFTNNKNFNMGMFNYGVFKDVMKHKKFPSNIHQARIIINPKDKTKLNFN